MATRPLTASPSGSSIGRPGAHSRQSSLGGVYTNNVSWHNVSPHSPYHHHHNRSSTDGGGTTAYFAPILSSSQQLHKPTTTNNNHQQQYNVHGSSEFDSFNLPQRLPSSSSGRGADAATRPQQRQTAEWVANSMGTELYKSLLQHLDKSPSSGIADGTTSTSKIEIAAAGSSTVQHHRISSTPPAAIHTTTGPHIGMPSSSSSSLHHHHHHHQLSRVSSLSESILQDASCIEEDEDEDAAAAAVALPSASKGATPLSVQTDDSHRAVCGSPGSRHLGGGRRRGGGGGGLEEKGNDEDGLFSFPVTPSEAAATIASESTKPLFGSWASFRNALNSSSPGRKSADWGDDGTNVGYSRTGLKFADKTSRSASQSSLHRPSSTPDGQAFQHPDWDSENFHRKYEILNLKVVHPRNSTGFEDSREIPLTIGDVIAGKYKVVDLLGQAAFSRAVQAIDVSTGALVCLKIIKNNKDYFDQSLDEIKLLQYINACDPGDEHGVLRLHDFFYYREHLILVCELLRANLYEFGRHLKESGGEHYFTPARIKLVSKQVLGSLAFLHSLNLIHADLKPENILIKSYSRCQVKIIDLGSSCFLTDRLNVYVQSRSYRAPEVIIGLPYDQRIDVWSLGCILMELYTGRVLFQNDSLPALLARMESILGHVPQYMLRKGRFTYKYYCKDGNIYDRNVETERLEWLKPKKTSLEARAAAAAAAGGGGGVGVVDQGMIEFISCLLQIDPNKRPTAEEALQHPWLLHDD
jgi:serine/threonine protein kinase